MNWHNDNRCDQEYLNELYNEQQIIDDELYNSFDSQSNRSRVSSNIIERNSRHHSSNATNLLSFDCTRSKRKFANQNSPILYSKLFNQVKLYQTNQKRISHRFHHYKNLFPNLKDEEIIQLVKDQFKQQKHKFQTSGKDPKKQYQEIIKKRSLTKDAEQFIMSAYIQYESDLEKICYEFNINISISSNSNSNKSIHSTAFTTLNSNSIIPSFHQQQSILPRQIQLILIVRIKASICKLQQFIKQRKLAKIYIPFNQLQLNQISYRFLEVHRGKIYSMDKALPLIHFTTIFSREFIQGKIKINQKEAFHIYKFMVNVLSAVQSQNFSKKEKFDIKKLSKSIADNGDVLKESSDLVLKQNLSSKSPIIKMQHLSSFTKGIGQNNKQIFDQWYSSVVNFYLQCGDWKKVLPKLLSFYGTQFKYFKWSVLQRKVQSFLRVVYQHFLSKLTQQNKLFQYKKQLPQQSRIKFIHITTWKVHQPLLFMLFYFYIYGNQFQPYHLKEIVNYLIKNKEILCSNKKQMSDSVLKDLLKVEGNDESIVDRNDKQLNEQILKQSYMIVQEYENKQKQANKKDYKQKQQKIKLKEYKSNQNTKQVKQDSYKCPLPSYTLEQKLIEYQKMWRQQAQNSIKLLIKEQIKKQPRVWRKMQSVRQQPDHFANSLTMQQSNFQYENILMTRQWESRGYRGQNSKDFKDYQPHHNGRQKHQKQQQYFSHHQHLHQLQQNQVNNDNENTKYNFERYKTKNKNQFLEQVIKTKLKQKLNQKIINKQTSLENEIKTNRFGIEQAYCQTIWGQRFYNLNSRTRNLNKIIVNNSSQKEQKVVQQKKGEFRFVDEYFKYSKQMMGEKRRIDLEQKNKCKSPAITATTSSDKDKQDEEYLQQQQVYQRQEYEQGLSEFNQLDEDCQEDVGINPEQQLFQSQSQQQIQHQLQQQLQQEQSSELFTSQQQQQQQLNIIDSYEYLLQSNQQNVIELNNHQYPQLQQLQHNIKTNSK